MQVTPKMFDTVGVEIEVGDIVKFPRRDDSLYIILDNKNVLELHIDVFVIDYQAPMTYELSISFSKSSSHYILSNGFNNHIVKYKLDQLWDIRVAAFNNDNSKYDLNRITFCEEEDGIHPPVELEFITTILMDLSKSIKNKDEPVRLISDEALSIVNEFYESKSILKAKDAKLGAAQIFRFIPK